MRRPTRGKRQEIVEGRERGGQRPRARCVRDDSRMSDESRPPLKSRVNDPEPGLLVEGTTIGDEGLEFRTRGDTTDSSVR